MKTPRLNPLIKEAAKASATLKALAHEMRLLTVCHIGSGEKTVGELETFLQTSQSNVSQHLAKLRDKGILETRKAGNQVFYRVKDKRMLNLVVALQQIYC